MEKPKRDNSPSPQSYSTIDAKDYTLKKKVNNIILPKMKNNSFLDQHLKEKAKIPGVCFYNEDSQWKNQSRKLSVPRFKRGI